MDNKSVKEEKEAFFARTHHFLEPAVLSNRVTHLKREFAKLWDGEWSGFQVHERRPGGAEPEETVKVPAHRVQEPASESPSALDDNDDAQPGVISCSARS